ncbi:MAG: hypothetical protein R3266_00105 [Gemmatimonadota bacterium]|nr:hypothetical protein [Gemmatimonadota bacterium]
MRHRASRELPGPRSRALSHCAGFGRVSLVVVLGLLPIVLGSCDDGPPTGGQRLPGSASSLEELASTVLAGLASADTSSLEAVRLTETEHNEMVWPELPASAPGVNFPVDFAWANISLRHRAALSELLPAYRDRELEPIDVECRGATQSFESFAVHTDCWVTLERDGELLPPQQLFKDVLDWDGEYKIFRYYEP